MTGPRHAETKVHVARLLAGMMRCDRCVVYDIDRDLAATGHINHDGNQRLIAAYDRVRHLDPLRPAFFARRAETVVVTGWNLDPTALTRSSYYEDFMRPMGLVHKAELVFRTGGGRLLAGARLTRQSRLGGFSEQEVDMLRLVQPVIESHLNLSRIQGGPERRGAFARLSDREWAVCKAAAQGLSNKEICQRHGTSLPTVKSQLASAFRKLSLRNRSELTALYAMAQGEAG